MFDFFDWITNFLLETIPSLLMDYFKWVLDFVGFVFLKVINIIFEFILPLVGSSNTGADILGGFSSAWNGMPSDVISLAVYLNIPTAVGVIMGAYVIRFLRSLIPFIG